MKPAYTPEYCEAQYNNRARVPEHPSILARWAARSAQARADSACRLDLEYGAGHRERLDLFPARGEQKALLVFIHGGYWRSLDKSDNSFLAPTFIERGVSVALISYGLCPQVRVDDIVRQSRTALAWLWRNAGHFGVDASRLFVAGNSAGGHLTAMMATTHWPSFDTSLPVDLVKGAIPISGLYDLEPLRFTSINQEARMDAAAARRLSPIRYTPAVPMPFVMAVGGAESEEFRRQNQLLIDTWAPRCSMQDVPLPGFNHFTVVEQLSESTSPLHRAALALMGA
jgi:arylformamidase